MEKRRKQKRPSGKQKEKWSRKCGNIAPRNCAQNYPIDLTQFPTIYIQKSPESTDVKFRKFEFLKMVKKCPEAKLFHSNIITFEFIFRSYF